MQTRLRALTAIQYAFLWSIIASFNVVGIGAILFGWHLGQWSKWQAIVTILCAWVAGVVGAVFGVRVAEGEEPIKLKERTFSTGHSSKHFKRRTARNRYLQGSRVE
jgi:hypothetical protein